MAICEYILRLYMLYFCAIGITSTVTWCCSVAAAPLDSQYYEWKHLFDGRQLEKWMRQSHKLTFAWTLVSDDVKHHTRSFVLFGLRRGLLYFFNSVFASLCNTPTRPWSRSAVRHVAGVRSSAASAGDIIVSVQAVSPRFWSAWILCVKMRVKCQPCNS